MISPTSICSPSDSITQSLEIRSATTEAVAGARCALNTKHLRSLSDAFALIPDHRSAYSRRHSKVALYSLIAHGLLTGAPDVLTHL